VLPLLLAALDQGLQAPLASSLGRLWDGFAAVLGLLQRQTHEGQAALRLESLASAPTAGRLRLPPLALPLRPGGTVGQPPRLDWQPLLRRLLDLLEGDGVPTASLALWLHHSLVVSLVRGARWAARRHGCRQVALSGGCFQNALLLDGCIRGLGALGLEPLWSQQIPANDGGLALGQLWAALQTP
jgi:hydrogenase maturation protein HypF